MQAYWLLHLLAAARHCQLRSVGVASDSYNVTVPSGDGIDVDDRLFVRRVSRGLSHAIRPNDILMCLNDQVVYPGSINRERFNEMFLAARQEGTVLMTLQRGSPYTKSLLLGNPSAVVQTPLTLQVVNLARRADRWSVVSSACEKLVGVDCVRFPAVDGREHELTKREMYHFRNAREFNMLDDRGVVGCALSHLHFWQQAAEPSSAPWTIVLEDDLIPRPQFAEGLELVLEQLPADFDLVFIAHQGPGLLCPSRERFMARLAAMGLDAPPESDLDLEASMDLCPSLIGSTDMSVTSASIRNVELFEIKRPLWLGQGTGGYILSQRGAKKLVELYEEHGMPDPVDKFMINHFMHLQTFITTISLCHASSHADSDTGTTGKPTPSTEEAQEAQIRLLELKVAIEAEATNWYLDQWIPLIELYQERRLWEKSLAALSAAWKLELEAGGGGVGNEARGWYQQKSAIAQAALKTQQTGSDAEL
jgi:GR25 family glycosyltransferase involved in LPS biosynthesis